MYREPSDNSQDSGWRFFSGDEDQKLADDPGNFALYDVRTISAIDPDIVPLLGTDPPCAFERLDSTGPFVVSTGPVRPD